MGILNAETKDKTLRPLSGNDNKLKKLFNVKGLYLLKVQRLVNMGHTTSESARPLIYGYTIVYRNYIILKLS